MATQKKADRAYICGDLPRDPLLPILRRPGFVQMCERCHKCSADVVFDGVHLCTPCLPLHKGERARAKADFNTVVDSEEMKGKRS